VAAVEGTRELGPSVPEEIALGYGGTDTGEMVVSCRKREMKRVHRDETLPVHP